MARSDDLVWEFFETLPGKAAALYTWDFFLDTWAVYPEFKKRMLRLTHDKVSSLHCPTMCRAGCLRRIINLKTAGLVSVCPDMQESPIRLCAQDIQIYRVNQHLFNQDICAALGIECRQSKMTDYRHTWYLGEYIPYAGTVFPVFLCQPSDIDNLIDVTRDLCLYHSNPFVLAVLTRQFSSLAVDALLNQRNHLFLPLNEELVFSDNAILTAHRASKEIFSPLTDKLAFQNAGHISYFPTPIGIRWEDITIQFVDGHTVKITVGNITKRYTYTQMGMYNKNTGNFTDQWKLLLAFAEAKGSIDWCSRFARDTLKKQKQELSKRLRKFMRLEEDPIEYIKDTKTYRCRFRIISEGGDDDSDMEIGG